MGGRKSGKRRGDPGIFSPWSVPGGRGDERGWSIVHREEEEEEEEEGGGRLGT